VKLVYNLGGINHARDALRIDHRSYKQRSYTSSEKMQIDQAVIGWLRRKISLKT
jgi:hypothetical protein